MNSDLLHGLSPDGPEWSGVGGQQLCIFGKSMINKIVDEMLKIIEDSFNLKVCERRVLWIIGEPLLDGHEISLLVPVVERMEVFSWQQSSKTGVIGGEEHRPLILVHSVRSSEESSGLSS